MIWWRGARISASLARSLIGSSRSAANARDRRPGSQVRARVPGRPRRDGPQGGTQLTKDYVLFPLLAGPSALPCLLGNLTANVTRNIWAHTAIFCGHFPAGAETFTEDQIEGESRGSGTYGRHSVRRTSMAALSCTSSPETSATRSSTISSPTCPATAMPRSLPGCARCARSAASRTPAARCRASTPPLGPASGAWRSPDPP